MREEAAKCFGRNLFLARRRLGMSQEELAGLCSLHRTEIGLLEHGRRIPRIDTLIKIASSLDIEAGELLRGITWTIPSPEQPGFFVIDRPQAGGRDASE